MAMASSSVEKESGVVEHLVADSAAFLKCAPLQDMGNNVYTIEEVVSEIRDKATRQRLNVLPYDLKFREPSAEAIGTISAFARKIGDYRSLSAVDIKVLALTYQLHREFCGVDDLKLEPSLKVEITSQKPAVGNLPGFYYDPSVDLNVQDVVADQAQNETDGESKAQGQCEMDIGGEMDLSPNSELSAGNVKDTTPSQVEVEMNTASNSESSEDIDEGVAELDGVDGEHDEEEDEEMDDNLEEEDEDDEDDGWITPSNIRKVQAQFGEMQITPTPANVPVGCLTTDFAMQNVLIQMGLHVVSVDGMLIKEVKNYVLKCYSCFKVCKEMNRQFCPSCGNRTLVKVAVTVDENGVVQFQIPKRRRPFNIRGKKHPLPLPKGGRHAVNPILYEDQSTTKRNMPRSKDKTNANPLDPDYAAKASPFAVKDVHSRASALGFHKRSGFHGNPNKVQKKTGRRK